MICRGSSPWTHNAGVRSTKQVQAALLQDRGSVHSDNHGIYVIDHQGIRHNFPDRDEALRFAKALFHHR